MLQLGMIGLGAIGHDVLRALDGGEIAGMACPAVLVRHPRPEPAAGGSASPPGPLVTADPEAFFAHRFDAVLEVAGHAAVRDHAERALQNGADLLVTSVGAFADDALLQRVLAAAQRAGRRVVLPSAGIGALDILAGAARGGLDEVVMTVRKDAASWKGTVAEQAHDLDALREPVLLYDGPARGGAAAYPQNVNIAAAVSLAGLGLDRTRLRIWADPGEHPHIVEVEARGRFGRFSFREEVVASEENRKTGLIVAMAVIKTLRQLTAPLVVGH